MKSHPATVRVLTVRRSCRLILLIAATVAFAALALIGSVVMAAEPNPHQWTNWRGPSYDNSSAATNLPDTFDPDGGEGSNLIWKSEALATRSTPIVMNGKLYTLARHNAETPTEAEKVICADAATGEILWENIFNVYLSDVPDTRVAWSNVVGDPETNRIYAQGVCGLFQCIDAETGKTIWSRSLHEEFGLLSTYGGRTNTPILVDDLVIISAVTIGWGETARPAHRFWAFDKSNGEVAWYNGTAPLPDDTTYGTPAVAVIDGELQMIFGSGDGHVWAFQPRTGRPIWKYELSLRGLNTSPLVRGNIVYTGQSEENADNPTQMGAMLAIDATTAGEMNEQGVRDLTQSGAVWRIPEKMVGKSSPLMVGDQLVGLEDSATLLVFDPESGEQIGRQKLGTMQRSTPLVADGKMYVFTVNQRGYILEVKDGEVEILHRTRFPRGYESHGSPICANGRIFIPTTGAMYCIGLPDWEANEVQTSPVTAPAETPVAENPEPAQVQLVPAQALVRPGEEIPLKVRLYNKLGQELAAPASGVTYEVDGPGEVSAAGVCTAAADGKHQAATIHAKYGDATGQAAVRIVPDLPWSFDFADGEIPIPWVGARYRHVIREVDGEPMMVKITTIPKGTRSQAWFGHPDLSNYTIEADVKSGATDGKMPDIGLIAQRYTLDLQGEHQKLEIRSWPSVLRMARSVEYSWQPDTWYRMKFKASIDGDEALLQGKVWPKGEEEPAEWTVEARDPAPNLNGSPGLFGNATNAEIFIDNIQVE
ncbi:MAG: PQQ-binding-like beta-propeller repeat protein [Pirellulales bacterium]